MLKSAGGGLVIVGFILFISIILGNFLSLGVRSVSFKFRGGPYGAALSFLYGYFVAYGPLPFLKSCFLGFCFGRWFLRLAKP